jgi:hypothetical protein
MSSTSPEKSCNYEHPDHFIDDRSIPPALFTFSFLLPDRTANPVEKNKHDAIV